MKDVQRQLASAATPGDTPGEERCRIQAAFRLAQKQGAFTRADITFELGWSKAQWQVITAVCNAYHLVPTDTSSPADEAPTEDFVRSSIQAEVS